MTAIKHPIRNTIFYGFAGGLFFVPTSLMLNAFIPWSRAACLTLWLLLTGYALLLNIWSKKFQSSTLFPLLILLPAIFLTDSLAIFFIPALIVFSWIRSGICYQKTGVRGLAVELLLCFLSAVLSQIFTPGPVSAWTLGIWMFFLVQALYFVFFEHTDQRPEEPARMDAFEWASRQAERVLTDVHVH